MSLAEVRLTSQEKEAIHEAVEAASAKVDVNWKRISLFGSRVNPALRGGDIDLYIEIAPLGGELGTFTRALRIALEDRLGERKIDLVIDEGTGNLGAFGEIVRQSKVDLWTRS